MVLGIYGAGGAGKVIKNIAIEQQQWEEVVFIDDTVLPDNYRGVKRMPFVDFANKYKRDKAEVIIAIGEPQDKITLYNKVISAGFDLANVVHRTALVSKDASLGRGIIINAGVVVSADAIIEDNVGIETYSVVSHDSVIHAHAQISAHVMIAGHCEVGEGTFIGINACIRNTVKIGAHSVIGMGAVVVKDVPDGVVVMGNPAQVACKRTDEDRVFKK